MIRNRILLLVGIILVAIGGFLAVIGLAYGSLLCFGGFPCRGEGVLAIAELMTYTWGLSPISVGAVFILLGPPIMIVAANGKRGLKIASIFLCATGALLTIPVPLFSLIAVTGFMIDGHCGFTSSCNPSIPIGLCFLGGAGVGVGFAVSSSALKRFSSRLILLGLLLEITAALAAMLAFHFFFAWLMLPALELGIFGVLLVILTELNPERKLSSTSAITLDCHASGILSA